MKELLSFSLLSLKQAHINATRAEILPLCVLFRFQNNIIAIYIQY